MVDKKQGRDWIAIGILLLSLAISAITAYRTVPFQRDDIRVVVGEALRVMRDKNDFRIEQDQEFAFINSGNRQAVVNVSGRLVLVTDRKAQCSNRFIKSISLDTGQIVLKPGDIQPLRAKVLSEYPWKK